MAVTEWQAEAGGVVVGGGAVYVIDGPITGLGVPAPRISDLDLPTGGTQGGRDLPSKRIIGIPVSILGDDAAAAWGSIEALLAAWQPTSTDTTLDICLPGMGTVRWTGRPRGVDLDLADLAFGGARARLVFEALNPDGEPQGS